MFDGHVATPPVFIAIFEPVVFIGNHLITSDPTVTLAVADRVVIIDLFFPTLDPPFPPMIIAHLFTDRRSRRPLAFVLVPVLLYIIVGSDIFAAHDSDRAVVRPGNDVTESLAFVMAALVCKILAEIVVTHLARVIGEAALSIQVRVAEVMTSTGVLDYI